MHTNGDSIETIILRCREEVREFDKSLADHRETQMGWWKELAGDALQEMLAHRNGAEAHLRNPSPKMRIAALSVLANYWSATTDKEFAISCENLVGSDPAPDVRAVAVTWLGACYKNRKDRRIARLLAGIVCEVGEPMELRCSAYHSLCSLFGIRLELALAQVDLGGDSGFPNGVDWKFVARCLDGAELQ